MLLKSLRHNAGVQKFHQNSFMMARYFSAATPNKKVFFDINANGQPLGKLTFELYSNEVPKTAENFRSLCTGDNDNKYTYKGSGFHRIIQGFMAQGGDFTNHNGTGGRSIYGNKFDDERSGMMIKHTKRGQLSMANAGPNTNGSQFFICFIPTPHLNGAHCVFGHMIDGDDVLDKMESAGTRGEGAPKIKFDIADCGEVL